MEKGQNLSQIELNQPSRESRKETVGDKYSTFHEDIAEVAIDAIQPCPLIPDYKTPTLSTLPIIARTPDAHFCIDGWNLIEQARADGRSTIRCHIYHIPLHSNIELAFRKAAIRVMPQGGKCSYAELVRNTHRLYQALLNTTDDLVQYSHGGDRRSVGFTDSKENNIRAVLANRLGKSPTTISKYLQHGDGLDDATMEKLVNAGTPKHFFEAFQVQKQIEMTELQAAQKDETAIVSDISDQVSAWWNESQQPLPPQTKSPESPQLPQARHPIAATRSTQNHNHSLTASRRTHQELSDTSGNPVASYPTQMSKEGVADELKRIGETLIEIADSQQGPSPQQVETIRRLIQELAVLHQRLVHPSEPEGSGNGETA